MTPKLKLASVTKREHPQSKKVRLGFIGRDSVTLQPIECLAHAGSAMPAKALERPPPADRSCLDSGKLVEY
jgi:hypothetical protein